MNDWGVPDWQGVDGYHAPPRSIPMLWWAWQFLRRNPEYRAYWQENVRPLIEEDGALRDDCGHVIDEIENKFGLLLPRQPSLPTGATFLAAGLREIRSWTHCPEPKKVQLNCSDVGYIFDMTFPLERQFARALKNAKELQKYRKKQGILNFKYPRETSKKYITYLRVLDADDAGAIPKTIQDILFPELNNDYPDRCRSKALANHRIAARRLRDTDYRLLAALSCARVP